MSAACMSAVGVQGVPPREMSVAAEARHTTGTQPRLDIRLINLTTHL